MGLKELEFSDLFLTPGKPECWFVKGTREFGEGLCRAEANLHADLAPLIEIIQAEYGDLDPSVSLRVRHNNMSFRVAIYEDVLHGKTFFLRRLPEFIPDFRDLGIPNQHSGWLMQPDHSKGIVLFAGPQTSGKTTSANAFIKARLTAYGGHAVTFEHPVEMPLAGPHGARGYCWQADIRSESELPGHIERTHRYSSPNMIFIGEIRTKYAATEALRAALGSSKQLVVATIHGTSLSAALNRLLTWAREQEGAVAEQNLSQTLAAVVYQELKFNESLQKRTLDVVSLLVPFDDRGAGIRAKLADGNLFFDDDIREQQNRFHFNGRL